MAQNKATVIKKRVEAAQSALTDALTEWEEFAPDMLEPCCSREEEKRIEDVRFRLTQIRDRCERMLYSFDTEGWVARIRFLCKIIDNTVPYCQAPPSRRFKMLHQTDMPVHANCLLCGNTPHIPYVRGKGYMSFEDVCQAQHRFGWMLLDSSPPWGVWLCAKCNQRICSVNLRASAKAISRVTFTQKHIEYLRHQKNLLESEMCALTVRRDTLKDEACAVAAAAQPFEKNSTWVRDHPLFSRIRRSVMEHHNGVRQGVYCLCREQHVMYVGETSVGFERIWKKRTFEWDTVVFIPTEGWSSRERKDLELAVIYLLCPERGSHQAEALETMSEYHEGLLNKVCLREFDTESICEAILSAEGDLTTRQQAGSV